MTVLPTRRRAAALGAALALLAAAPPAGAAAAPVPLRAEAEAVTAQPGTVRLVVGVEGVAAGERVDPASVRVSSRGRPWEASAEPVESAGPVVPRTAVLAVDTSGSMGEAGIADARAAAERFLDGVPADVAVGLVTFAADVTVVVPPTADRDAVRAALGTMRPSGDTRLYDGISASLAALGAEGDRALVLLSDGKDTASTVTLGQVGEALGGAGVTVDLVAFRTESGQVAVLDDLAGRAGGRVTEASTGAELARVFADAAQALTQRLVVTASVPEGAAGTVADLVVEVAAGGGTASVAVPVTIPAPPPPPPAPAAPAEPAVAADAAPVVSSGVPWFLPLVLVVTFLGLLLLFAVALTPATWRGTQSARRIGEVERYGVAGAEALRPPPTADVSSAVSQAALAWAGRAVQRRGVEESWRTDLDRADVPLRPHEWLIVRLSAVTVGLALGVVFLPWWLLTAPAAGAVGWLLTGLYLRLRSRRRLRRFAEGLPDVLQLVAGSLQAGFSLPQAVDNAAKEGEQPLAGELSRALAESRLGVSLEDTLERVAGRMKSTDLGWTVMAIRIAREVGGNLAEVLLSTASTMRERERIQRQVRALSAEGRLSAYVLVGLPVGITLFLVTFRREYVAPLVTDPIGWVMTFFGVASTLVGVWVMSRMIKLEV